MSRENVYQVCLRNFDFSKEERAHYGHGIEQGAYFLIAEHEHPFEKQPNKARKRVEYYEGCGLKKLCRKVHRHSFLLSYSGIFPCFLYGRSSCFVDSISSA